MPDAVETMIANLLMARLENHAGSVGLPVAWPNMPFTPPAGTYLRADILWNHNINRGIADSSSTEHRGIFQVTVVAPAGTGIRGPLDSAGAIAAAFGRGAPMPGSGVTVKVEGRPSPGPALQESDRVRIAVSIRFHAFA